MTGAPLPPGCDAVVMHERTQAEDNRVRVDEPEVRAGQNILPRGREMRAGEVAVSAGTVLKPAHLGVLASVGRAECAGRRARGSRSSPPATSWSSPAGSPAPARSAIRTRSCSAPWRRGTQPTPTCCRSRPTSRAALREILRRGLEADVLLDHRRRLRRPARPRPRGARGPGSPPGLPQGPAQAGQTGLVRGRTDAARGSGRRGSPRRPLVFGLPGNPVSGVVGYLLFVRPALGVLSHRPGPPSAHRPARLTRPFRHRGDRPTYHPARLVPSSDADSGPPRIETLDWAGSADLRTVALADGFAAFPAGDHDYDAGAIVEFVIGH